MDDLRKELDEQFSAHNKQGKPDATSLPATFLQVTVTVSSRSAEASR
jgi:hypothetical protein